MGNNGFVTDSDTERKLRAWQTARDTPILDRAIYFKQTAAVGKTDAMLDNIIFKL